MDVTTMFDIFTAFGFESDDEMTDTQKLEALNSVYHDVLARENWPFLQASVSLTFDGTGMTPTNDPGDINAVLLAVRNDGWQLDPWRLDDFYQTYASQLTTVNQPFIYFFEAGQIKCFPVPNSTDTVLVKYQRVAPDLDLTTASGQILLPSRYHRSVLVMGTLAQLALMQDDTEMMAAYQGAAERAILNMTDDLLREQFDRTDFIHVNDPDNWDYSA